MRFSPDGKCIAVAVDGGVLIGNVRTGKWVKELRGHCHWVTSVTFMPGGTRLVSGSWDRTVKVWDISLLGVDGGMELDNLDNDSIGKELLEFKGHKVRLFYKYLIKLTFPTRSLLSLLVFRPMVVGWFLAQRIKFVSGMLTTLSCMAS